MPEPDAKTVQFVGKLLHGYYSESGPLAPADVAHREFGFGVYGRKIAYRHCSFGTEQELRSYLVRTLPPFVSCSSAHYRFPAAKPMESKRMVGSDLVFDLDADDLDLQCRRDHGNSWVCGNCLSAVKEETIRLVEEFLVPDFGFSESEISFNFSGNRGYHVHVASDGMFRLGPKARNQIADYITGNGIDLGVFFPTLGQRGARLEGPRPDDGGWGGKMAQSMISALNRGDAALAGMGIDRKSAGLLTRNKTDIILGITTGNWDKVNIPRKAEFWQNILKLISIKQSNSIDKNVVKDIHHLIRLPDTVHGDTGLAAKKIGSLRALRSFDPMKDAVAFRHGRVRIKAAKVPGFSMCGKEFGPYDGDEVEVPAFAGAYMLLKGVATIQ